MDKTGKIVSTVKKMMTSEHLLWGVAGASLLESTVVPIPLELLLIPLMQTNRARVWRLAAAALAGCIAGALIGYGAGFFFQSTAGDWLVSITGSGEKFSQAARFLRRQGFWFVFSVGVTPMPFQVAMVAAGAADYSIPGFLAATALSRAIRYFGLAGLVWAFGDAAERLYRKHRWSVALAVTVSVAVLWVLFLSVL